MQMNRTYMHVFDKSTNFGKKRKKPDLKIRIHELKNQNTFTVELLRLPAKISSKNIIHQILPMVCLIRFKTCVEQ